ncbi:MAG: NADH-quinone oxidoreductase subunit J [Rickettsiales bacterium]
MVDLIFYSFAFFTVMAAFFVVTLRNPVHAVLFLIFAFFNAAGLFLLLGAEFIAMTLIIVYVGAVAVLFLFVVMMLNIKVAEVKQGFLNNLPLMLMLGGLVLFQILYAINISADSIATPKATAAVVMTNTKALGMVLYTQYFFAFQMAGVILLVAMIGAILLTLTPSKQMRRQSISKQISRTRTQGVHLTEPAVGEGVKI